MQLLIETVEQLISNKKSEIKYHNTEANRIRQQVNDLQTEIIQLQNELGHLKGLFRADNEKKVLSDILRSK